MLTIIWTGVMVHTTVASGNQEQRNTGRIMRGRIQMLWNLICFRSETENESYLPKA